MAAERGMNVLEFSEFAEGNDDIDKEIDKRQAEKAREADRRDYAYEVARFNALSDDDQQLDPIIVSTSSKKLG